jgi:Tol biopolymer transport system component
MTKKDHFRAIAIVAMVALAVSLLILAGPAGATFPGTSGRILFESSRLGQTNIFAMNPDGTEATLLTNVNDNGPKEEPVVSPDGSKIAYVYGRDIWVMNSDGSGPRNLTNDADSNDEPAWSADGTRIAFSKEFDLFTMNADGTGKSNITNTPIEQESQAAFSPDGSQIAYNRSGCVPGGGNNCIYKTNADGTGTPTNLTPETNVSCVGGGSFSHQNVSEHPSWSPDGQQIAFRGSVGCSGTSGLNIWVMNSDGSGKTDLIQDNGTSDDQPAFSPDGQQIVFLSNRDTSSGELYTYSSPSGVITRLTTNSAFDENPDWQPVPACTITGTAGDDVRTGTGGKDVICGLGGNDQIDGLGGNDILIGGEGNDRISGSADNDMVNGGAGVDTVIYSGSAAAVQASLEPGFSTGEGSDLLSYVEGLTGSNFADFLNGSATANTLHGLGGSDTVIGSKGNDRLFGESGADVLKARDGMHKNDRLDGGPGRDACQKDRGDRTVNCP